MVRISERWTRRSTRVTTQAALGKTSFHSPKDLLVVKTAERQLIAARDDLEEQIGVTGVVG